MRKLNGGKEVDRAEPEAAMLKIFLSCCFFTMLILIPVGKCRTKPSQECVRYYQFQD